MTTIASAHSRRRRIGGVATAVLGFVLFLDARPAKAVSDAGAKAGIWTLSLDNTNRSCRVNLRTDAAGSGLGLAMPPGCRRAVPALRTVQSWSMPQDGQISLDDETGASVVVFAAGQAPFLQATLADGQALTLSPLKMTPASENAGEGGNTITTLNAAQPEIAVVAAAPVTAAALTTPASTVKAKSLVTRDVAGRYAVMRGDRDTGCMVTLDPAARGPKNTLKAHLAPACRDQGIIVFDPLGWQMETGGMVLTARKGHSIRLDQGTDGTWVKQPADAKALGLKPI